MMKTGIAVALTILITAKLNLNMAVVAVITAVVTMQPSIMRSVSYIKEVALSTVIGVFFALAGAYTLGLQPVSIGITVILAIAVNIKFGWLKTVNITILTISIIMLSGDETINLMYLVDLLLLLFIVVRSVFFVYLHVYYLTYHILHYYMIT